MLLLGCGRADRSHHGPRSGPDFGREGMPALPAYADAAGLMGREPTEVIMVGAADRTSVGNPGNSTRKCKQSQPHRDLNPTRLPNSPTPAASPRVDLSSSGGIRSKAAGT